MTDHRVSFDFEVVFSNGGALQGQGFRLDIDGDSIDDDKLAAYLIRDLRLLMVAEVRIHNRKIFEEPHKRARAAPIAGTDGNPNLETAPGRIIDLSHSIEHGMITYKGLPAPLICDHLSREQSRKLYAPGTEFQIGRIDMVANTGTYIDTPYHRYPDGYDLTGLDLERIANVPAVVVRVTGMSGRAIDWTHFVPMQCKGSAVLVHTGWDRHWRTDQYFEGHPFLTQQAAEYLRDNQALLVGIDSLNIDDTSTGARPVHTGLLRAGIPIVEHLTGLEDLPASGFTFTAVPPKIKGLGTFSVRAHARLPA